MLQFPDDGTEERVSEMFCVKSDVGVVGWYAGDVGEIKHCGEENLGAEEDGIDKVEDIRFELDDTGESRRGEEVPL
jgi:hypothetical protein